MDSKKSGEEMTKREGFEISFCRPKNFLKLTALEQWEIDKGLGILDWEELSKEELTEDDEKRIKEHYE